MNWIFIAILAQIILGTSLIFDKLLLKKRSINPYVYSFWLGLFGLFSIFLLFIPVDGVVSVFDGFSVGAVFWGFLAGSIFIIGMFYMFVALSKGEASSVLPTIGAFSPVFTLMLSPLFLKTSIGIVDSIAFFLMVLGGGLLLLSEARHLRVRVSLFAITSAVFIALSGVFAKITFNLTSFVDGFVLIKLGGVLFVVLFFVLFKKSRERLKASSARVKTKHKFLYFANRTYAAVGSIIVYFAISLAHQH